MRERGETEAGGVRVLLQSVAPSQSGSETLSWRGYGEDGCCVTLNIPHLNAVRIPAVLHPLPEGALGQYRVTELRFFGTIGHCHSGILNRVHTRTHTHITQHLLYLLLRPKTLVPPPPFVHCLCTHTLSNTFTIMHRRKCNSPTGASFREPQSTVDPISKGSNPNMQRG